MDTPVLADPKKLKLTCSVQTTCVIKRTCQEQQPVGIDDGRESRESVVSACLDAAATVDDIFSFSLDRMWGILTTKINEQNKTNYVNNNNNNGNEKQNWKWKKIQKEYLRRTRKLLKTKLNRRNLIKRINTWAVSLVRYSGPFLKWTRDELKQMDQRTNDNA